MQENVGETLAEPSSLVTSPIDFYEIYLEKLIDILFPTPQSVAELLKEAVMIQRVYMTTKIAKDKRAPSYLKTLVVFFFQKLASKFPKAAAAKLKGYLQTYVFSVEFLELESSKKRLIATTYCLLEHSMLPHSEEYFGIPRAEDVHPSYCLEVEPIGLFFAAIIECPVISGEEKRTLLSQFESIREVLMASPQAHGSWVYAPDCVMEKYNLLYGNELGERILKDPSYRDEWMEEQPRLGLFLLALEVLGGLTCLDRSRSSLTKIPCHLDTLGSFKPDFRKWREWKMSDLLNSAATCGTPFFTNMRVNSKLRQVMASPWIINMLSSASVSSYAAMLQE